MKCFYHSADFDGQCAGAIVRYKYPGCTMIGIDYGDEFPWQLFHSEIPNSYNKEDVYMVDFSIQPFYCMEKLSKICKLHWVDHHKTAILEAASREDFNPYVSLVNTDFAGCELTWKYLFPDTDLPEAVQLFGRYDIWDLSFNSKVLPFQYGAKIEELAPDREVLQSWWIDAFENRLDIDKLVKDGEVILKYQQQEYKNFCKTSSFETKLVGIDLDGNQFQYNAIACNRGNTGSRIFNSVYIPDKHDVMISFSRLIPPAYKWIVSLYSTKQDIDCGLIAKAFGGGGHKGAAGFVCTTLPFVY